MVTKYEGHWDHEMLSAAKLSKYHIKTYVIAIQIMLLVYFGKNTSYFDTHAPSGQSFCILKLKRAGKEGVVACTKFKEKFREATYIACISSNATC